MPIGPKETCFFFEGGMPSGYLTVRHGKSPFLIGKPSISMSHGHFFYREIGPYKNGGISMGESSTKLVFAVVV